MKFKVGDRVRVYNNGYHYEARVQKVESPSRLVVSLPLDTDDTPLRIVSLKQCRRLKPKAKPREIWVNIYKNDFNRMEPIQVMYLSEESANAAATAYLLRTIKFREVKE